MVIFIERVKWVCITFDFYVSTDFGICRILKVQMFLISILVLAHAKEPPVIAPSAKLGGLPPRWKAYNVEMYVMGFPTWRHNETVIMYFELSKQSEMRTKRQ